MIATEFLRAVGDFLQHQAGLNPPAQTVGIADPVNANDLPAIVLSLTRIVQLGKGLGERSEVIDEGALAWSITIDLANPVLPEEPSFPLVNTSRLECVLPHGGLVRVDGSQEALGPSDISVEVNGTVRPVVSGNPSGDEVRVDPLVGRLFFATALPATGNLTASYFLGQWEQKVSRISGMLRIAVRDASPSTVADLSNAVVEALQPSGMAVPGLHHLDLINLGRIRPAETAMANSRVRDLLFSFEYELTIDRPESSGGIILRIPVTANIDAPTIVAQ